MVRVVFTKLLGVVIQYNWKWDQQIDSMVAKANTRKYFITILKRSVLFVRPLQEYAAPVWHPGLTIQQSDVLEQVQRQVLLKRLPLNGARGTSSIPCSILRKPRNCTGLPTLSHPRSCTAS